jgi:hypothetical protein
MVGEAGSTLPRTRGAGFTGASEARVLDRIDPLATLAAKRDEREVATSGDSARNLKSQHLIISDAGD